MMFQDRFRAWWKDHGSQRAFTAAASGDDLELNVLDVIGYDWWSGEGVTTKAFKRILDKHADAKNIRVVIDSPGGSVFDGVGIYNALRRHGAHVTTEVIGLAASAASLIALAGDDIEMNVGTELMIHQASTIAWDNADGMQKTVDALRSIDSSIVDIYVNQTNLPRDEIVQMMSAETWMTADDAVTKGFASRVLRKGKTENRGAPKAIARPMNMTQMRSL